MSIRIPGISVAIVGDITQLKVDLDKAKGVAREAGAEISKAMNGAVTSGEIEGQFNKLVNNLSRARLGASVAGKDFSNLGVKLKEVSYLTGLSESSFQKLQSRMLQTKAAAETERAFAAIGKQANLSGLQMVMLRAQMGDTHGAFKQIGEVATTSFGKLYNAIFNLKTLFATIGITYFIKDVFEAGRAAQSLDFSFKAIFETTDKANEEFEFLRKTADELGQNFWDLADAYKGIAAAGKYTSLSNEQVRDVFWGTVAASSALQLTSENLKGTLYALGQIMSKGKVTAEEVRRQMGDRLYGAFQLAAKACGITTAALDDMLKKGTLIADDFIPKFAKILREEFGEAGLAAATTATAAVNKFSEAWMDIKVSMANAGVLDNVTAALRKFAERVKDPDMQRALKQIGTGLGNIIDAAPAAIEGLGGITEALGGFIDKWNSLPSTVTKALTFGLAALWATKNPWVAAMAAIAGAGAGLAKDLEEWGREVKYTLSGITAEIDKTQKEIEQIQSKTISPTTSLEGSALWGYANIDENAVIAQLQAKLESLKNKQVQIIADYWAGLEKKTQGIINATPEQLTGKIPELDKIFAQIAKEFPPMADNIVKAAKKLQDELAIIGLEGYDKEKKLLDQQLADSLEMFKDRYKYDKEMEANRALAHEVYRAKVTKLDEKYYQQLTEIEKKYYDGLDKEEEDSWYVFNKLRNTRIDLEIDLTRQLELLQLTSAGKTKEAALLEVQYWAQAQKDKLGYTEKFAKAREVVDQITALRTQEINKSSLEKLLEQYANSEKAIETLWEEGLKDTFGGFKAFYADILTSGEEAFTNLWNVFRSIGINAVAQISTLITTQLFAQGLSAIIPGLNIKTGSSLNLGNLSGITSLFSGSNASDFFAALNMGDTFWEALQNSGMLGGGLAGAGAGALVGRLLGTGTKGTITGTLGGIAGSFLPIPGGSIIGSVAGSLLGDMFGGGDERDPWEDPNNIAAHWERLAQVVGGLSDKQGELNRQIRDMAPLAAGAGEYLGGYGAILGGVLETVSKLTPGTAEYADVIANQLNPAFIIQAGLTEALSAGTSRLDAHQQALAATIDSLLSVNMTNATFEQQLIDLLMSESGSVADLTVKYQRYQEIESQLPNAYKMQRGEVEALVLEGRTLRGELGLQGSAFDNLNSIIGTLADAIGKLNPAIDSLASAIAGLPSSKTVDIIFRTTEIPTWTAGEESKHLGGQILHGGGAVGYDYPEIYMHAGGLRPDERRIIAQAGEFMVRKSSVTPETLPALQSINHTGRAPATAAPVNLYQQIVTQDGRTLINQTYKDLGRGGGPVPKRIDLSWLSK